MKLKNSCLLFIFLSLSSNVVFAQKDSATNLSFSSFLQIVRQYHPVIKQAELIVDNAKANNLFARGEFDPKLFYGFDSKFYNSKNYYEISNGGFQIPTWYGLDFKLGIEKNTGDYLNPQQTIPVKGLIYSQISVPLLQGLIIDDRRATLKKAIVFQQMSNVEKIILVNELLYNAGKAYWDWQLSFSNLIVLQNAKDIAEQRFIAVKRTAELGDRPFIDTVESHIQLQERMLSVQQAMYEYQTKSLLMSNFLWMDNNIPVELNDKTKPEFSDVSRSIQNEDYDNNVVDFISKIDSHPELKTYQFKLNQFDIDKKLKQDKLKPKLHVNYSPLYKDFNGIYGSFNNYKWGLSAAFPLFLRKERAELKMVQLKIDNLQFEAIQKRTALINKIKRKQIEWINYKSQCNLYFNTVGDYRELWTSEKKLFESGESSLFMINSREMSYLNAQLKFNDILVKTQYAKLDLIYSMCQMDGVLVK